MDFSDVKMACMVLCRLLTRADLYKIYCRLLFLYLQGICLDSHAHHGLGWLSILLASMYNHSFIV